jgi:predicted metal-dependent enzyme (double-stranded beta helix superfamily)
MATSLRSAGSALSGWLDEDLIVASPTTLEQLEQIVTDIGQAPWLWGHTVSFDVQRRSHRVLYKTDALEIALFGWAAGQDTRFHDHGGASGAAFICSGMLIEDVIEAADGRVLCRRTHKRGAQTAFSFGPEYIHRVRQNPAYGVALSIHAYTLATTDALDYDVRPDGTIDVQGSPEPVGAR